MSNLCQEWIYRFETEKVELKDEEQYVTFAGLKCATRIAEHASNRQKTVYKLIQKAKKDGQQHSDNKPSAIDVAKSVNYAKPVTQSQPVYEKADRYNVYLLKQTEKRGILYNLGPSVKILRKKQSIKPSEVPKEKNYFDLKQYSSKCVSLRAVTALKINPIIGTKNEKRYQT